MTSRSILALLLATLASFALTACRTLGPGDPARGISFRPQPDRVEVLLDGRLWTAYVFTNTPRPFCYPLLGPGDTPMTRNFPMQTIPGEERDHPHHRSFWFAHTPVGGHDFWTELPRHSRIVHQAFEKLQPGSKRGLLQTSNLWVSAEGQPILSDRRTLTFHSPGPDGTRVIDFEISLHALGRDVVFGDSKEGTFALRVAESMPVTKGKGHILNSRGDTDRDAWGKRAEWCDYSGPIDGRQMGLTLFDHPANPRHPTWWHVRDYGLFAANPFGRHDFEALKDRTAGDLTLTPRSPIKFRYRLLLRQGPPNPVAINQAYRQFTQTID